MQIALVAVARNAINAAKKDLLSLIPVAKPPRGSVGQEHRCCTWKMYHQSGIVVEFLMEKEGNLRCLNYQWKSDMQISCKNNCNL